MIDFSALVEGPCQSIFGQPCMINPCISQPHALPYSCSGIYTNKPIEITTNEGLYHSANQQTIAIRLADFLIPPVPRDQIITCGVTYDIYDMKYNGKGGADLWLKRADRRS